MIDRPDPVAPYVTDDGVLVQRAPEWRDLLDVLAEHFMAARYLQQQKKRRRGN